MTGMLSGIRVVEMGHVVAVPSCAALLADWGADVIKVEPLTGEMARGQKRVQGVDRVKWFDGVEIHWPFQLLNRGKKGLAVDLKQPRGRDILHKLIQTADVFMSNYELPVLKKLEMDYQTLSRINPRLVYAALTAYGSEGPDRDQRGFDYSAAWARSGMQHLIGEPGAPPPPQRPGLMDNVAAVHIAAGVLGALLYREKTGQGQELEFSLYHSAVWTLNMDIQAALFDLPLPRNDRLEAKNPLWNSYRCQDDRWLQLVMLQPDLYWPPFCQALDQPELEKDPRFRTTEAREQHYHELIAIIDEIMASKPRGEWEKRFQEYNCLYGRIQTTTEVVHDPQALANGFFVEVPHPEAGPIKLVATPAKLKRTPAQVKRIAPEVGEHTEEILLELGYTWNDIAESKSQGTIL